MSKSATWRVCASCEWIFCRLAPTGCPKCGFAHYGARYVYGNRAYRYAVSQEPWRRRKLANFAVQLDREIRAANV